MLWRWAVRDGARPAKTTHVADRQAGRMEDEAKAAGACRPRHARQPALRMRPRHAHAMRQTRPRHAGRGKLTQQCLSGHADAAVPLLLRRARVSGLHTSTNLKQMLCASVGLLLPLLQSPGAPAVQYQAYRIKPTVPSVQYEAYSMKRPV